MKKTFLILSLLSFCIALKAQPMQQSTKEIWYTTTDGKELPSIPLGYHFGDSDDLEIDKHSYANGKGIISCTGDVTMVGNVTFLKKGTLKTVTLPSKIKTIGELAFCDCENLTSINFPEGLTTIGTYAFSSCKSLETVILPSTVSKIETMTFYGCTSLRSVTLPSSITYIGVKAFNSCENLKTITCDATIPPTIDTDAFLWADSVTSVIVPCVAVYLDNAGWKKFSDKFVDKYLSARNLQKSVVTNINKEYPSPMGEEVKENALHDIEYATSQEDIMYIGNLCSTKIQALYEIYSVTSVYDSDYLDGIVNSYVESITKVDEPLESAYQTIEDLKKNAISEFGKYAAIYDIIRSEIQETLPTEGTSGSYVKVQLGEKNIKLYNPEKVEFGKE